MIRQGKGHFRRRKIKVTHQPNHRNARVAQFYLLTYRKNNWKVGGKVYFLILIIHGAKKQKRLIKLTRGFKEAKNSLYILRMLKTSLVVGGVGFLFNLNIMPLKLRAGHLIDKILLSIKSN